MKSAAVALLSITLFAGPVFSQPSAPSKPDDQKAGDPQAVDPKAGDQKAGDQKVGDQKVGEQKIERPPDAPPPLTATVDASGVVGRRVLGPDDKEVGRVVDVLVDANGQARAAVIDFGGFLGVGSRRIAVDWGDLTFPPAGSGEEIHIDLTVDRIRDAPVYGDQTKPAAVVVPSAGPSPPGK